MEVEKKGLMQGLERIWKRFFPGKEKVEIKKIVIPKKVAIIIDGENLNKSLKIDLGGLSISNFEEFVNRLVIQVENGELSGKPLYYTSVDVNTKIPEKILRFFSHLAAAGFEVKFRSLPKGKKPVSEIDPWVSDGIYRYAIQAVSVIIVVSGDHHFVPAVIFAKEKGKKVIVVSTATSLSEELKKVSDQWINLENIIKGITRKSEIEKKRDEALQKLNTGKRITLNTLKEKL